MQNFKALTREERKAALLALGEKPFREKQIFAWINKGAESFDDFTDISVSLREKLKENYSFDCAKVVAEQISEDGTRKYLLEFPDKNTVEAVFMSYEYGNSLCISTQVGCNMGCKFCASTIGGKIRDLKAWEMLEEFVVIEKAAGAPINHIVLMGMGEPFDNYEEVSAFLRLIHDPSGRNISYRNITVSTCGIIPKIEAFSEDFPQVNLAISLHSATQDARAALMPIAKTYKLDDLIEACRKYVEKTGRRITFEYTLIHGKNDRKEDLDDLRRLLKGLLCHINLIPLNPVVETGLSGADRKSAKEFANELERSGIPATVRRELGRDINAACGQLRKNMYNKNN